MTVLTEHARVQYLVQYDGESNFGFDFPIFVDSDLKVYRTPTGQESNPPVDILFLNIDYTVNILVQSGSIDIILTSVETKIDDLITIERDVPATRTYDFEIGGKITGTLLDNNLDKITMEIGQNKSLITDRGLTYLATEQLTDDDTSIPKLEANQYWVKNNENHFVAGECTDTDGCSTLRSELASESVGAPGTDNVGYYDVVEGNQNLTEKLADLAPQKDNRGLVKNTTDETKIAKMDVSAISTATTRTIYMSDNDIYLFPLPPYFIRGLGFANDVVDPDFDILIKPGMCSDSTNKHKIELTSSIVKQIDANWAEGTNQGGFPSSLVLTADTWYHIFVISKNDGTVDCGFDSALDASNLLADATDYSYYRRIGSIYINSLGTIWNFVQFVDNEVRTYHWNPTRLAYDASNPGISAVLVDMFAPSGISTIQMLNFTFIQFDSSHEVSIYVSCPDIPDEVPSLTTEPLTTLILDYDNSGSIEEACTYLEVRANSNGEIRFRLRTSHTNDNVRIASLGWKEYL